MNNIKISVIIPVYNVEKYIRQCIDSVVNQTLKDIEIIVVNDGTKDNSMKIINEYISDKRIIVINKENGGLSSARNVGMKLAKGEYIYFLDSDDFINEETLEILYNNSENADIVFSSFTYYNEKFKTNKKSKFKFPFNNYINKGIYFLYNGEEINVWNKLYKFSFLRKYKFSFIENIIYEDQDFGFKTFMMAQSVKYINNYNYNYRIFREGSIMSIKNRELEIFSVQILQKEMRNFLLNEKLETFQKIRTYIKLKSFDFWEKELKNESTKLEVLNFEKKLEEIYKNNIFNSLEKIILANDIRILLKNKNINILNKLYWNYKIVNIRMIKGVIKNALKNFMF